ncbi:MAG: helix-turn-helix transcriptional regulator [Leptospiraceae bacterium]|nr:helix-turn-helix transcriptional regulator [Leptospiraceae bacterium]
MVKSRWKPIYLLVLIILTGLEALDATMDLLGEGFSPGVLIDILMVPMVTGGILYIIYTMSDELRRVEVDRDRMQSQMKEFRNRNRETLDRMRVAVLEQFQAWELSGAEAEVAEQLLRGVSRKEIAARLNKSERTVQNQTAAIYRKSGMVGRSDLAAFFMADILGEEDPGNEA